MTYDHLPATMTVQEVARELQLEHHTARKVIEASIYHIHLSARCIRIPRASFVAFLQGVPSSGSERPQLPESTRG